jgi:paraquat-inducible protein B
MNSLTNMELTEKLDRLRLDLAATWNALAAMQTVLTPAQRQQVLESMALASAKKQEMYDAPQATPEATAKLQSYRQQAQAAEDRLHQMLSGAPAWLTPAPPRR